MSDIVQIQSESDGITHIYMNRAEKRNAFNPAMIEALKEGLKKAEQDPNCRIIVLHGRGKHFSAGADLDHMGAVAKASEEENKQDALSMGALFRALEQSPKPIIAVVQGAAFGGAVGLACAVDFVVGSKASKFSLSEARLGLVPGVIAPHIINALGMRRAKALSLSAETITGVQAYQFGLITHLAEDEDGLEDVLDALCNNLVKGAPEAQSAIKELMRGADMHALDQDAQDEFCAAQIARARASKSGQSGIKAFLAKEKPDWAQD